MKKIIFLILLLIAIFVIFYYFLKKEPQKEETEGKEIALKGEIVLISTNFGDIKARLNLENAPITCKNFLDYIRSGFYKGKIFHRVIKDFMIQGGGFDKDFAPEETNPPIKNEADNGLKNLRGTIAMARTNDIHSATSQFFINIKDNDFLNFRDESNFGYAVFGEIIHGMDIVDRISVTETGTRMVKDQERGIEIPFMDVPKENVVIEKVEVIE